MWVSGGFAEEIIFRGYLARQFEKFFGKGKISLVINIVPFEFFGWLHAYLHNRSVIIRYSWDITLMIIFVCNMIFVVQCSCSMDFDTIVLVYLILWMVLTKS
jgi:membrane protease YdiL (CAAX protease family)